MRPTGADCRRSYEPTILRLDFLCRIFRWELELREQQWDVLLCIECQKRQIQDDSKPVAVNDEKEGEEGVDSGFGDDVGIKAVAQVDRVNVVTMRK